MPLQQLFSCIPGFGASQYEYDLMTKKNDGDHAIALVEAWKKKFPLDQNYSDLGYSSIVEYCQKLVKSIKPIPYNHTTSQEIGDHLVELAQKSAGVRKLLCDQLNMFNGTFLKEELRLQLSKRVRFVVSDGF